VQFQPIPRAIVPHRGHRHGTSPLSRSRATPYGQMSQGPVFRVESRPGLGWSAFCAALRQMQSLPSGDKECATRAELRRCHLPNARCRSSPRSAKVPPPKFPPPRVAAVLKGRNP
jgi:hypothetical protein